MALFSKHSSKKPEPQTALARASQPPRAGSAREIAANVAGRKGVHARPLAEPPGGASAAGASIIDWSPAYAAIEVMQVNPGLCTVLENAALLYASGQAEPARGALEEGVQHDHDTKLSPLAWLALFDLLQRAGDRSGFDQLAMQYVVQFERSAPAWEEPACVAAGTSNPLGGFVALAGKLSASSVTQWHGLRRAIENRVPHARLDLSSVVSFDDSGARQLAALLAEARRANVMLTIERPEKMRLLLDVAIRKGREGGQGTWLLALELMQWEHEQAAFDDRAVEFAIAFEVSPPSWEPPPCSEPGVATAPIAPAENVCIVTTDADTETLACSGTMAGANAPHVAALLEFALRRDLIVVDLTGVQRVDFVCAGALLNAINRIEGQRKTVQIVGASPIVRALLLLIGISPRHFVKKAA